jgi:hypothetical protein
MKQVHFILCAILAVLCLVQACAALTGSNLATTPSQVNALRPGDLISEVSGTVNLPTSGDMTFNPEDSVSFYTQLTEASWSISIVINGIENPARTFKGTHATIGGFDLAYPTSNYQSVALKFSMTDGTVPTSFTSGNINLIRAQELDSSSDQVGAAVYVNGSVINPDAQKAAVNQVNSDLSALKADIDAKNALGVDTSIAQQKYDAAKNAVDQASTYIISAPTQVQPSLDTATSNINAAKVALDQAWADMSLQEAKNMLASVDGLITEFTVNDSLKTTDSRLVAIINKRDLSAQAISNANDLFTTGSYPSARTKAGDGLSLANQAWNLSLDLKTQLGQGFQLPGLPNLSAFLPVIVVILVVAAVAGIIIYRRKMHWDELG